MIEYYQPYRLLSYILPFATWKSKTNKILFTFDDSPNKNTTEKILKALNLLNIKAMFFCNGDKIEGLENLIKEIYNEGHIIGLHSYNHIRIDKLKYNDVKYQIEKNMDVLTNVINKPVKYFRAPYGRYLNLSLLKVLNKYQLRNIMWTLLTYDFFGDIYKSKKILSLNLKKNDIIVFHDNDKTEKIISPLIHFTSDLISRRNYFIGEPKECLK